MRPRWGRRRRGGITYCVMEPNGAHYGEKRSTGLTEKIPAHCLGGFGPACMSSRPVSACRQNTTVGSPPLVGSAVIISEPTQDAMGSKDIAQPAVIAAKSPAQSTRHGTSRDVLGSPAGMPERRCNHRGPGKKAWPGGGPPSSVDPAGSGVPPVHPGYMVCHRRALFEVFTMYPASPCFVHGSPSTQPTGPSASERRRDDLAWLFAPHLRSPAREQ